MTEAIYQRKNHIIHTPDGMQDFKTINKAKKESRRLQLAADGALGLGSLRNNSPVPDIDLLQFVGIPCDTSGRQC